MFGILVDISTATRKDIVVIEDCAQALGASLEGETLGVKGLAGVFSFSATKMLTTGGQGGMVVSRARCFVEAVRDFREFDGRHDHKPRFNFQMTDLQAAIGRAQLKKLPAFVARRAEIYMRYCDVG